MQYKVVPFPQTKNINNDLQTIIDTQSADGWQYVNHKYEDYLRPGTDGCFGLGSRPNQIWHVGHVVFQKQ